MPSESERLARLILDPETVQVGDRLSYDAADAIDTAGRRYLEDRLARRGLVLIDDGRGILVAVLADYHDRA